MISSHGVTPLEFLDSLEEKQHIMLLYEDPEYAKLIEFRFIKKGLECEEDCIYATSTDSGSIVLMLQRYGIPLDAFLSKKIQVFQIKPFSGTHEEIILNCKQEIKKILSHVKAPFKMVARIIPDVSTISGMTAELEMERLGQACFGEFGGTVMCPYDISEIEKTQQEEWMNSLYHSHHAVIYLTMGGEGRVIIPCQSEIIKKT